MKIKLKKFPRAGANSLVIALGAGKSLKFSKVGDISEEIDQQTASVVMGKYPDCFSMLVAASKKEDESVKMAASPKNKAVV